MSLQEEEMDTCEHCQARFHIRERPMSSLRGADQATGRDMKFQVTRRRLAAFKGQNWGEMTCFG